MHRTFTRYIAVAVVTSCALVLVIRGVGLGAAGAEQATYYMSLFAYQGSPNLPRNSHTFASFIKVEGERSEVHTVSWMPRTLEVSAMRRFAEPGVNLDLPATLELARSMGAQVTHWGPYKIRKSYFDAALVRIRQLNAGGIAYKARDNDTRPRAVSCIHAVSDIGKQDNLLVTGIAYGVPATRMVVNYLRPIMLDEGKTYPEVVRHLDLERFTAVRSE